MSIALLPTYANPLRVCDSADFDGVNDNMAVSSGLSGAEDSKSGILSCWLRLDGGQGGTRHILCCQSSDGGLFLDTNNKFNMYWQEAGTSSIPLSLLSSAYTDSATWLHVLASWNMAIPGSGRLYINDVDDKTETTYDDATLDYTQNDWTIGDVPTGGVEFDGCMAELYFAPGQYLDFSLVANRRKFISASGKPVHLGAAGALPTGTAPIIYLHLDDGEAVANFATNRGTGGNFSITGTLETGSTSPSD